MVMMTYFLEFCVNLQPLDRRDFNKEWFLGYFENCTDVYLHTAHQLKWTIIQDILPADWYNDYEQEFISHKYFDWLSPIKCFSVLIDICESKNLIGIEVLINLNMESNFKLRHS